MRVDVGLDQHPGTVIAPVCSHFGETLESHGGGASDNALSVAKNQSGPSSETTTVAETWLVSTQQTASDAVSTQTPRGGSRAMPISSSAHCCTLHHVGCWNRTHRGKRFQIQIHSVQIRLMIDR
jgi:hypothetical protein